MLWQLLAGDSGDEENCKLEINPDRQRDKTKYPREGYSLAGAEPDRSLILRQGRLEKAQITQN